ncbi:MAG: AMP-binding protein [Actinomycetota bacterium]
MNLLDELLPDDLDRPFLRLAPIGSVDGDTLTYRDVDRRARRFVVAMTDLGVRPGDRILLQVPKSADALCVTFACLSSRIVFVPLNTAYTPAEVEYFATDSGASLVVCPPGDESALADAIGPSARVVTIDDLTSRADDAVPFEGRHGPGEALDAAAMLYTSGTTGRSKGAVLTHASLLANAEALRDVWRIEPDDVICHTLPIFHVHGLFVAIFPLMLEGAQVRLRERFDVDDVLAQLPHSSVLMGVPTHYTRLLADERFERTACAGLRLFTSGSAPMTEQTHHEFTERTGRHIVERYGMTETGILTSNTLDDGGQVPGTVGHPLPGHDVRVVDGAVEVSLPAPFAGYWNQPDKTAETLTSDGWFRTGDVGSLDDDGRLTLDGRASDMIISGGYNVYPKEIELVLDAVDGVAESAVIGVPHPDFGEGVVAVVVLDGTVDADAARTRLESACDGSLARFKHPKHYDFVDILPRNAMAKVQKNDLRERYRSALA